MGRIIQVGNKNLKWASLCLGVWLTSCQTEPNTSNIKPNRSPSQTLPGQVTTTGAHDHLRFQLTDMTTPSFKALQLDLKKAKYIRISVYGPGIRNKIWNTGDYQSFSAQSALEINYVPKGNNRIVTAEIYDQNKKVIAGGQLKAFYSSPQQSNQTVQVKLAWRFVPLSEALENLMSQGIDISRLNLSHLQSQLDLLIYGNQPIDGKNYIIHPSLISTHELAKLINSQAPLTLEKLKHPATTGQIKVLNPQNGAFTTGVNIAFSDPVSQVQLLPNGQDTLNLPHLPPGSWQVNAHIEGLNGGVSLETPLTIDPKGQSSVPLLILKLPPVLKSINGFAPFVNPTGLIGWWPGDGNARDHQSSYHGVPSNSVAYASGLSGQAFKFNGIDSMVQIGNRVYNLATGTVEFWFKRTGLGTGADVMIGTYGGAGAQRSPTIDFTGNNLTWEFGSLFGMNTGIPIANEQWYHVAMSYDTNYNTKVYLNGNVIANATSAAPGNFLSQVILGRYSDAQYYNGLMDEVKIYNRELTSTEIKDIYRQHSLEVNGDGFDPTASNNAVQFNNASSDFVAAASATKLSVTPALENILSRSVRVSTGGLTSNLGSFYIPPQVTGLSESLVIPGDTLQLWGYGFEPNNPGAYTVFMNDLAAQVNSSSQIGLNITVPNGVTMGNLTYQYNGTTYTAPSYVTPPTNLISWWRAENNANDRVATNHGVLQNGTLFGTSLAGQAFAFDGVNDSVLIPNHSSLNFPTTTQFTVSEWINPGIVGGKQRLVSKGSHGWTKGWHSAVLPGGTLQFEWSDGIGVGQQLNVAGGYTSNTWQQVVWVIDKSVPNVTLYVNGVFRQAANITEGIDFSNNTLPLVFGYSQEANVEFYQGQQDDIMIFNRALTLPEIQSLYQSMH